MKNYAKGEWQLGMNEVPRCRKCGKPMDAGQWTKGFRPEDWVYGWVCSDWLCDGKKRYTQKEKEEFFIGEKTGIWASMGWKGCMLR